MDTEQIKALINRLRFTPSYGLHSDEYQLRKDAADALEQLLREKEDGR
jgi:hypothetical protein